MQTSFIGAFVFLINSIFNMYLFVLTIRLVLAYVGSNYFDPITQFTVRITDFIVKPLRRIIPNVKRVELSTLTLIIALQAIKFLLLTSLSYGFPNIVGILILAAGDSLNIILQTFFYAIILQAILSWIQPMSPINHTLSLFTSPIMQPLHRIIPPVGGFDITPIPAILGLQFLMLALIGPIMSTGMSIALSS